jgi:hypothetical protein
LVKCQWFTAIILATWEAEIGRITVQSQPVQIVHETPISKKMEKTQSWLFEEETNLLRLIKKGHRHPILGMRNGA